MKQIILIIIGCLLFSFSKAQLTSNTEAFAKKQILETPKVDKRVELLSIVFRLAGNPEYNSTAFKLYTNSIEKHFSTYKNHKAVQYARELRNGRSVSYDAVMSMAIQLDENLNPLIPFTELVPEKRWNKDSATEFVKLLKKFYEDAQCEAFFKSNEDLYKKIEVSFTPVYESLDLNWYSSFYGQEPTEKFVIVIALGNGTSNYGPTFISPNAEKKAYSIMGVGGVDSLGMPNFNVNTRGVNEKLPTLLHEFNHSFVNYLLDNNKEPFKDSGEKIFKVVKKEMKKQKYGSWEVVLNEALVRAAVIKYFKDHNYSNDFIELSEYIEISRSFFWTKDIVAELENYSAHRDIYPTLESYMPKLAEAYPGFAENVVQYDKKRPTVESINEFKNGDTNVDVNTKTITINFNQPLSGKGFSIFTGEKGQKALPALVNKKVYYTNDNKSVVMEVQLEPDKEYQFELVGKNFKSPEGIAIKSCEVNFKTAK